MPVMDDAARGLAAQHGEVVVGIIHARFEDR
jgi:hypothetical protein